MAPTAWLCVLGPLAVTLLSLTGVAGAQPLVLEPKVVEAGSTFTLTVTSNGAFDLSNIVTGRIRFGSFFEEPFEPSDVEVVNFKATPRSLTVTGSIENRTAGGPRLLILNFPDMLVSLKFALVAPFVCPPSCQSPRMCVNKVCVLPPTKCNPRCQLPRVCNEERKRCEIGQ